MRIVAFFDTCWSLALNGWSNWRGRRILDQRVRAYPLGQAGRVVVYTAIFGGKDDLREARPFPGVDYVCFTDDETLTSSTWKIVHVEATSGSPRMQAKTYKVLPHRSFPDHDCSLWVDATHLPTVDPRYLVCRYLEKSDIALFRHPRRDCLYDEMDACLKYGKGDAGQIERQREQYLRDGYPRRNGLATCTVVLRRHHARHVVEAMEDWWQEICSHSIRDQLSFNYVAHGHGLKYAVIPGHVYRNHYFEFSEHSRPDAGSLSVGWILNGRRETASSRIMGDNVHEYLSSQGVSSKILFRPETRITSHLQLARSQHDEILNHNVNVLVILKLHTGRNFKYLLTTCRKRGVKIVYAVCDLPSRRMLAAADAVIANSDEFRNIVPRRHRHKLHIVFDGYEHEPSIRKEHHDERTLKLCLVSNHVWDAVPCISRLPHDVTLKIIGPGPEILAGSFQGSRVFRSSPFDFEYVPWELDAVTEEILDCDVGIIPWPKIGKAERIKSANRPVLFMSLGLPVIASPVPSYRQLVRQGETGFIARKSAEWQECIELLRDDPARRRAVGEAARGEVRDRYSRQRQGELYRDILTGILNGQAGSIRSDESEA